jgi:hypothetical protein
VVSEAVRGCSEPVALLEGVYRCLGGKGFGGVGEWGSCML